MREFAHAAAGLSTAPVLRSRISDGPEAGPQSPGIDGLTGRLRTDSRRARIEIEADQTRLRDPSRFDGAIPIQRLRAQLGAQDLPADQLPGGALHPRRIAAGVIAGIEDYGNKMGIPTVNGAILFDPGYAANPLVVQGPGAGPEPLGRPVRTARWGLAPGPAAADPDRFPVAKDLLRGIFGA